MGFPLYVTCCFSLAAFNILSLFLVFVSLISMCLGVFLLGFILYGILCASWTWLTVSFSMLGKFSTIISSKIFSYPFFFSSAAAAKSLQSCPTLCDLIDGSPPGSPVPGILQARTLEWVTISFSNAWKWKVKVKSLSRESEVAQLCLTLSDPMDCSPPGSSVHGICQARVLQWGCFFWDPCNSNVGAFDIVPEVSETILSSFHSFHFILLFRSYFHHSYLPAHWFVLLLQIFCCWFFLEYF